MWIIQVETRSFEFLATGETEAEARRALAAGWRLHCEQTGADPDYVDPRGDGNAREIQAGQCWRDDAILPLTYADRAYETDADEAQADRDEHAARNQWAGEDDD